MKKILFISHEASRTGAPLVLLSLLQDIKRQHPDEELYVLQVSTGALKDTLEPEFHKVSNLFTIKWDDKTGIKRFLPFRLRQRINRYIYNKWLSTPKFDLIYANTIASIEKAVEIKDVLNIPVLAHIHEQEYTFRQYGVKKEHIQKCDRFIAVSTPVVETLKRYGVKENDITLIRPFSTNLDKVNDINKSFRISGVADDDFVIGLSGAGGWRKGFDFFPLLVKTFTDKYPQVKCKFVWVGWGDKDALDYESKHLGVQDYIVFTDSVNNPLDYYNRFDVFLLTSREDPFPLVCMECAALAKPIILFKDASGIQDMVRHNHSGLLVPYMDLDAMTDAIYQLYSSSNLRKQMGENLRMDLFNNYGKDKSINEIKNLLK